MNGQHNHKGIEYEKASLWTTVEKRFPPFHGLKIITIQLFGIQSNSKFRLEECQCGSDGNIKAIFKVGTA